jgi:tetratricopeptide (TPR) repeat protein
MSEEFIEELSDDIIFEDAMDALRRGDRSRAKELLTLLLKTDQNNPTYWIWLSAAVDNTKERIYCLQTALNLDPDNGTAKRGLILLGALAPDESVQPFPMNRPRVWEEKLLLAHEKPREKGLRVIARSPAVRLLGVLTVGIALVSAVIYGFVLPRQTNIVPTITNTPGPSPTFTSTPTLTGGTAAPTLAFSGPTPLWMLLPATYTPTPLYVNTPRSPQSLDQYRFARLAYESGDWDTFIANMQLIIPLEPDAPDIPYLIGEAYRFKGQNTNALNAYAASLGIDANFAPPYLGQARVRLRSNPNFNAESLLNNAIRLDPNYGEAYLERARFYIFNEEYEAALADLNRAVELLPNSPEVYQTYVNAYLGLEDRGNALEAAEKSYSLDITHLPIYKILGDLYFEDEDYQRAIEALSLYVIYENQDSVSLAMLGQAYFEIGDYEGAVDAFDKAIALNRTGLRRFYIYRGLANLELGNADDAVRDLEVAVSVDGRSYEANMGLVKGYFEQEKFGSAFLKLEVLRTLAETDEQRAEILYWRGLVLEERGDTRGALNAWNDLLALNPRAVSSEMRAEALRRLEELGYETPTPTVATPTRTPTPSRTPTPTRTSTPSRTPTP